MNESRKKILRVKKMMSEIAPVQRTLYTGTLFRNAERTGDDVSAVGKSWKEYWQIFALQDFPETCPFCGEPLNEEDVDGCHIKISGPLSQSWSSKKYIIPGHHGCNMQLGEELNSKIGVTAVEAIDK